MIGPNGFLSKTFSGQPLGDTAAALPTSVEEATAQVSRNALTDLGGSFDGDALAALAVAVPLAVPEGGAAASLPDFFEFVEELEREARQPEPDMMMSREAPTGGDALPSINVTPAPSPSPKITGPSEAVAVSLPNAPQQSLPAPSVPTAGGVPSGPTQAALAATMVPMNPTTRIDSNAEVALPSVAGKISSTEGTVSATATRASGEAQLTIAPAPQPVQPAGNLLQEVTPASTLIRSAVKVPEVDSRDLPLEIAMRPTPREAGALLSQTIQEEPAPSQTRSAHSPTPAVPVTLTEPASDMRHTKPDIAEDPLLSMPVAQRGSDARSTPQSLQSASPMQNNHAVGQNVIAQLGAAIRKTGSDTVELRLDPPELGHVRVSLTTTGDQVAAQISTERPEIGDMMRRHADLLQRELTSSGFRNVTLDFGTAMQNGQGGTGATPRGEEEAQGGDPEVPPTIAPTGKSPVRDAGLNLRV